MLPDLLGLAVVAAVLSVPLVTRRLRGTARAQAARPATPAVAVQPSAIERVPYDDGPLIGGPS